MAGKLGKNSPTGHTAGIFADMTLDGPEIGTLVAVIDRAKNLPNRRTMGKQDPYCAMRLGKEAKKTGTDRRGGQTPKWDQELRFTVHDSPDYYRLKCSVFNDDKKTDLIGEAWIDLTGVVIPGGGQNDLWHQLQFKGKYAGDVRMELTYYDTRPKDPAPTGRKREKEKNENDRPDPSSSEGSGPRRFGPREVKRRPLPRDPLAPVSMERPSLPEQVHSVPLPPVQQNNFAYQTEEEHSIPWASDSQYHIVTDHENPLHAEPLSFDQWDDHGLDPNDENRQPQEATYSTFLRQPLSNDEHLGHTGDSLDLNGFESHSAHSSIPNTLSQPSNSTSFHAESRSVRQFSDPSLRSSPYQAPMSYGSSPPSFSHDGSGPELSDNQQHPSFRRYSTSPIKNDVFRDSPLRQSISQHDVEPSFPEPFSEPFPEHHEISEDEGPPPPPPAHRSNLQTSASSPDVRQDMPPVTVPQPLNLGTGNRRMSPFDRSPLQSIERNYAPDYQNPVQTTLPSAGEKEPSYLPYSKPTYSAAPPRARVHSFERPLSGIENTPPSLRLGYGRGIEEVEDPWLQNDRRVNRKSTFDEESPRPRDMDVMYHGGSPYQLPRVEDEQQVSIPEPTFVKARTRSPDVRAVPKRKAVSPQPFSDQVEQKLSGVPFGPDSYEIFNPSSPSSSSVAGPETRYETPEQSKEAARQHEVQKLRDQGPIIGNDGRVIDPSDHLPTDTWAPEPERKTRKPEMVIRYKTKDNNPRTPNGYGSSPGLARPHSTAGSMYGSSPLGYGSPVSSAQQKVTRNRLQKQTPGRPLPVQPYQQAHSSPTIPTSNHHTPSPQPNHFPRQQHSDYSIRGQQDQGHFRGGSLGASSRGSYGGAPPIPAKLPLQPAIHHERYPAYGEMDALSAELSTIDIGIGSGGRSGRMRRDYGS